ncbi:Coenzyme F420 hydrogenase/dehydrogenase, beta subunit C-terminal domain [bacterium]|nr:Coenzyme F420 hydrogenase/dehydrogenase, beta subunit C-terminal domain [bacterium]
MLEESFDELKKQVIDTQLCFFCGLCSAVCSMGCISFKQDGPELDGDCSACGRCLEACPGLGAPLKDLEIQVFGRVKTEAEEKRGLGIYLSDKNLVSSDTEIQKKGYTGGKLTALLAYLLEKKEIDAAIVSHWGSASPYPWVSWPVIADSKMDLIKGAGSKYVFSPNLLALEAVAGNDNIQSVAVVGLGCHMQGLRKLAYLGESDTNLLKKVKYAFGLYCGAPMVSKDDFLAYVSEIHEVPPHEIASVNFKRISKEFDVAFEIGLQNGNTCKKQLHITHLLNIISQYRRWYRCRFCTDYAAEYADISFGGVHITCRTPAGEDVVNRALGDGWLIPSEPNKLLDNMAEGADQSFIRMKKVTNVKRINEYKRNGKPVPCYD